MSSPDPKERLGLEFSVGRVTVFPDARSPNKGANLLRCQRLEPQPFGLDDETLQLLDSLREFLLALVGSSGGISRRRGSVGRLIRTCTPRCWRSPCVRS